MAPIILKRGRNLQLLGPPYLQLPLGNYMCEIQWCNRKRGSKVDEKKDTEKEASLKQKHKSSQQIQQNVGKLKQ